MAESKEWSYDGHDGGARVARTWSGDEQPRFVALLCHGYGEHVGRYEHVAGALVEHGGVVHGVDHVGHGRSGGERVLIEDFEPVVDDFHLLTERATERDPGLPVVLVGHSMGGMIAAEMACLDNARFGRLALLAPVGLWLDAHPLPDLFATPPWELPALLFADPAAGQKLLLAGFDFGNDAALTRFMVDNARRLGSAGKILFPIPNRRLSKRLYRLRSETLLVWGRKDRLVPPVYAARWEELVPSARLTWIEDAAHMLHVEQPAAVAEAIATFLG